MDRRAEILNTLTEALAAIDGQRTPLDLVGEIPDIEAATQQIIADRVADARTQGLSWEAIAGRLGISRQAAHKRFGKGKVDRKRRSARIELRLERSKRNQ